MKAQTLALCVPGEDGNNLACDKKCPYCVSEMTWSPRTDLETWVRNLKMVKGFAERAQVTDVVITGKGEPTKSLTLVRDQVLPYFGHWPIVLQTNGIALCKEPSLLKIVCSAYNTGTIYEGGISVLAVSIDTVQMVDKYAKIWKMCDQLGIISRITVMLTSNAVKMPFMDWVKKCKQYGIRQLSFREISVPTGRLRTKASDACARWVHEKVTDNVSISQWLQDFNMKLDVSSYRQIRRLPYGAIIKDVEGIAVTRFGYCVQDENGEDDIRSLIYHQDGHLYTTWNSPASLVF